MKYFITGTDTGVGKTYFTAMLTRALRRTGFDTVALKPICCGPRDDVEALRHAADNELSPEEINPVWLRQPAAPLVAAREEGRNIDLVSLADWFAAISRGRKSVLIEGAGGWLVPLTPKQTVADLAALFGLPVLVVVADKLGCLNHTQLTLQNIRSRGLSCAGLVLNAITADGSIAQKTNRKILAEICEAPLLFEIQPGQTEIGLAAA